MLDSIKRILGRETFEAKVRRLAKAALTEASRLFESGDLAWTKGVLLANGGNYSTASHAAVTKATRGCALGGLGKAAWIVAGRPEPGTDAWTLKEYVEATAFQMADTASFANTNKSVPSFNDSVAASVQELTENVFKPARDVEVETLPRQNWYSGEYLPEL